MWGLAAAAFGVWFWLGSLPPPALSAAYDPQEAPAYMAMTRTGIFERFNLNTATAEQLQSIEGVGEVLSQRILEYLKTNGPIREYEELLAVEGVGEKRLEAIRKHTTLH